MTQAAMIGLNGGSATAGLMPAAVSPERAQQRAELEKAAKAFEAIFARQLLGSMRSASLGESLDGSSAVDQFREMSDANMAQELSSNGSLGIAELILKQLDR
jgi:flagellar protein FlgJ